MGHRHSRDEILDGALATAYADGLSGLSFGRVAKALVPPLALILIVLGSIFKGWAPPTEAGALGAVGAMLLAAANRRLTFSAVRGAVEESAKLTTMVLLPAPPGLLQSVPACRATPSRLRFALFSSPLPSPTVRSV